MKKCKYFRVDSEHRALGAGPVTSGGGRQQQESKQDTDTPSILKVIAAYFFKVPMLTLRKTQPGVTQRAANYKKHNYKKHVRLNKEKTLQVSERALQKWSPQKCQTLTADADRGRKQH